MGKGKKRRGWKDNGKRMKKWNCKCGERKNRDGGSEG